MFEIYSIALMEELSNYFNDRRAWTALDFAQSARTYNSVHRIYVPFCPVAISITPLMKMAFGRKRRGAFTGAVRIDYELRSSAQDTPFDVDREVEETSRITREVTSTRLLINNLALPVIADSLLRGLKACELRWMYTSLSFKYSDMFFKLPRADRSMLVKLWFPGEEYIDFDYSCPFRMWNDQKHLPTIQGFAEALHTFAYSGEILSPKPKRRKRAAAIIEEHSGEANPSDSQEG